MVLNKFFKTFLICVIGVETVISDPCSSSPYSDICIKLGSKSYLIDGNARLNWFEAERLCRRQNGYLVSIQNQNEIKLISDYLAHKGYLNGDQKFWIGASDLGSRGKLYSIETGNLLSFTKWSSGQPNTNGQENCVVLAKHNNEFLMSVSGCGNKLRYVCEIKEASYVSKKIRLTYQYV